MRTIDVKEVTAVLKKISIEACTILNDDVMNCFKNSMKDESPVGKAVLEQLVKNAEIAKEEKMPICQDTGFSCVFMEIGQDVHLTGGSLREAVDEGIRQGYTEGYLRKSVVKNPLLDPKNSGDNTPAILHTDIVLGEQVKITIVPKGGGSENMSRVNMMKPADGVEGVKQFVLDTVRNAGPNPCPPIVVGVGMGGTFDYVTYLAKKSLMRKIGERNKDPKLAELEKEWLEEVNKLGIGPGGLGGKLTAMDLFIEEYPRHIASYPAAVNIQCHAARCKSCVL